MSFKITITETRELTKVVGKDYAVIGEEEVARDRSFLSKADEPPTRITKAYGYTPEIEKRVVETREVLVQDVDELNLKDVICAINGIDGIDG